MSIRSDIDIDPTMGIQALDEMDRATVKYARKQERLWRENQESIDALGKELRRLKQLRDTANDPRSVQRYNRAISKLESEQEDLRQEAERYGRAVDRSSKKAQSGFKGIGQSAKAWIAGAAVTALYALQRGLRKVITLTSEWEDGLAEVSTLVDTSAVNMESLDEGLKDIATEVEGTNWDDLPKALYQTISAGVDASNALEVVRQSAKSAVAGVTDVSVAVDGITTAINAWGLEAEQAEQVSDSFFTAVKAGKTTFDELSKSIGRAAPLASTAGSSVETLLAAVSALTTAGLDTREAMTAVRGIFQKILKPTQQAKDAAKDLGIEFNTAALRSKGLFQFLQDVKEATGGNTEAMGRLFEDVEALNGVLSLTGGASEKFAEILGQMEEKSGATAEAFDKMDDTASNIYQLFNNKLNRVMEQFGKTIMPTVIETLQSASDFLEKWRKSAEKTSAVEGALSEIGGLYGSDMTGWNYNQLKRDLQDLYDQSQKNVDAYSQENRQLAETIKAYSTWGKGIDGWKGKIADANEELRFRAFVMERNIERMEEQIEAEETSSEKKAKLALRLDFERQKLQSVNKQLEIANKYRSELNDKEGEGDQQRDFSSNISTANLDRTLELLGNLDDQLNNMSENSSLRDLLVSDFDMATGYVQQYNRALTKAHNELKAGEINHEQYKDRVESATEFYLEKLKEIYKSFKGNLTPEQEKFFNNLFKNFEDAGDETEGMADRFDDLADTVDSIINVADAIGGIGDNARRALTGVSDLVRNAGKLTSLGDDAGFLDFAIPGLGLASGLVTTISGLFGGGNNEMKKSMDELVKALKKNARDITKAIDRMINESRIGADITGEQADQAAGVLDRIDQRIEEFNNKMERLREQARDARTEEEYDRLQQEMANLRGSFNNDMAELFDQAIQDLLDMGVIDESMAEDFREVFQNLKDQGFSSYDAFQKILSGNVDELDTGLREFIETLSGDLGGFSDSIGGAISKMEFFADFMGSDLPEQFDVFMDHLLNNVDGFSDEVKSLLEEASELDITTEEGKKRLKEIIEAIAESGAFGDLTPSQIESLLSELTGFAEGDSASGSEADGYSRSVQIARTITDVQANEMIMFLERIEKWTRDTAAALGSNTAISVNETGGTMPSMSIPVPLPVKVVNDMPASGSSFSQTNKAFKKNELNVGDINIGAGTTEADIDELTNKMARKLKEQLRGNQF